MPNYIYPKQQPIVTYEPPPTDPTPPQRTLGGDLGWLGQRSGFYPALNNAAAGIQGGMDAAGNYLLGNQQQSTLGSNMNSVGQAGGVYKFLNNAASGIYGGLDAAGNYLLGNQDFPVPQTVFPTIGGSAPAGRGGAIAERFAPSANGRGAPTAESPNGRGSASAEGISDPRDSGSWSPASTGGFSSIVQKEQNDAAAREAAAAEEERRRIQAEWERYAPLAQQWGLTQDRLVNTYMNPNDPGSQQGFTNAGAKAHSDDLWAQAMFMATGHHPNQVEWDEHSISEDYGGRDPLEGHGEAIEWLKQAAAQDKAQAQSSAFDAYQNWLSGVK